ncbi:LapA family protein [Clostridium lundense]|uniref:LapA family protein n=1 Tax=Clostridium lundense TaxID=319475 RepID=UPI00068854E6|nr:lipopolysaccharide assembly protein LapA domain-containing protein [Clostridium lundense]
MQFGFILSLVFAILITIFAIQNSSIITVSFLFAKLEISQALIIFISVILGALIIMLLGLKREFSLKHSNKQLTKKLDEIKLENSNLLKENKELKEELEKAKNLNLIETECSIDKE